MLFRGATAGVGAGAGEGAVEAAAEFFFMISNILLLLTGRGGGLFMSALLAKPSI